MPAQPGLTVDRLTSFGASMKRAIGGRAPLAIAGGAVRDVLNNRPVKDIDIFVQVPDWEHEPLEASELIDEVVAAANKLFYSTGVSRESTTVRDPGGHDDTSDISYDIHSVWHWSSGFNCYPCDIVFIKEEAVKCYEAFDFGLCQALVSPTYGLRTSRAYQRDVIEKTITYLLGEGDQKERSKAHLGRFQPKYQGWKIRGIATAPL